MLSFAKRALKATLAKSGKTIVQQGDLVWPVAFARALGETHDTTNGSTSAIVFSKDRAMQLHAFLASYLDRVTNPVTMTILYRASTAEHAAAYRDLAAALAGDIIRFLPERSFRDDLISHAINEPCEKIVTFVDDMIFKERFDFASLTPIDTGTHILSLTRGRDLTYSSVLQKTISVPPLTPASGGFLAFDWRGPNFSDWTFPLGVSGYMFGRREWIAMLRTLDFRAPNSLEAAMQRLVPIYETRTGLCTERAICVCVHANMVQTEFSNPTLGNFSIEALLQKWQSGLMIDRAPFYDKDLTVAEAQDYSFVPRA